MSIRNTTITQLRQMEDQEGLVLQGCGGSLQEWQDGINQLLTEEGILQGGTKFEDVCAFQHEGCTCLLFPFTPEVRRWERTNPRTCRSDAVLWDRG